jgi:hypothetical protein
MEVDIELAKKAIYWRGLFIFRYAGIEYAIAELVSRTFLHQAYRHLGAPPFGPAKKLQRLNRMIELAGPIASYRTELQAMLDDFAQYAEHRNFMVHAIMVPASSKGDLVFRMYDHREGIYSVGDLHFEMTHLEKLATMIAAISAEFTSLVAKMCREIPLPEV